MSFILDALKKSESERQRHHGPSVAEIPYGRRRSTQPLWMGIVVALLLVNMGILTYVLLRKEKPTPGPATQSVGATPAANSEPTAQAPTAPAQPLRNTIPAQTNSEPARSADVRSLATEAVADPPLDDVAAGSLEESALSGPKLVKRIGEPDAASSNAVAESSNNSSAPTLDALGGAQAMGLPELHLDIHVYSPKSNERFVFINMRKYMEGQPLTEGPTLERISTDGVVLEYRGKRFSLPRR